MTSTRRGRPPVKPQTVHIGSSPLQSRSVMMAVLSVGLVAITVFTITPPGNAAMTGCHRFLEYYSGVFSLVALSLTVMGGIAATDRLLLLIQHRVLLQAIHRATAMAAVAFLVMHIALKILEGHAGFIDVLIPFLAPRRAAFVGVGTIAAYLMVLAAWTGVVRARFTENSRPWLWRALHSCAYMCWPIALFHGLKSGRPAAGWVTASYAVCLIMVSLALLVRMSVKWGRRLQAPKASTTSTIPRIPGVGGPARSEVRSRTAWGPSSAAPTSGVGVEQPVADARISADRGLDSAWQQSRRPQATFPGHAPVPEATRPPVTPRSPVIPGPRLADNQRVRDRRSLHDVSDDEFWDFMRGGDDA